MSARILSNMLFIYAFKHCNVFLTISDKLIVMVISDKILCQVKKKVTFLVQAIILLNRSF